MLFFRGYIVDSRFCLVYGFKFYVFFCSLVVLLGKFLGGYFRFFFGNRNVFSSIGVGVIGFFEWWGGIYFVGCFLLSFVVLFFYTCFLLG